MKLIQYVKYIVLMVAVLSVITFIWLYACSPAISPVGDQFSFTQNANNDSISSVTVTLENFTISGPTDRPGMMEITSFDVYISGMEIGKVNSSITTQSISANDSKMVMSLTTYDANIPGQVDSVMSGTIINDFSNLQEYQSSTNGSYVVYKLPNITFNLDIPGNIQINLSIESLDGSTVYDTATTANVGISI